jgi:hypothetical protein
MRYECLPVTNNTDYALIYGILGKLGFSDKDICQTPTSQYWIVSHKNDMKAFFCLKYHSYGLKKHAILEHCWIVPKYRKRPLLFACLIKYIADKIQAKGFHTIIINAPQERESFISKLLGGKKPYAVSEDRGNVYFYQSLLLIPIYRRMVYHV